MEDVLVKKWEMLNQLIESGLVAVIRRPKPEYIEHIVDALVSGGVGALEITVDTTDAYHFIQKIKRKFGHLALVGAGTVLDEQTAKVAIDADADFIFSPVFDVKTVQLTNRYGKISIPGVMTPTEIVQAYQAGADIIKVFPASALGVNYFRELRGPLGHIPMMPTGGVNLENVGDYIRNGAVAVGVGGNLLDKEAIEQGRYDVLFQTAQEFAGAIRKAKNSL